MAFIETQLMTPDLEMSTSFQHFKIFLFKVCIMTYHPGGSYLIELDSVWIEVKFPKNIIATGKACESTSFFFSKL